MRNRYKKAKEQIANLLERCRTGETPFGYNVVMPSAESIEIGTLYDFEWISIDMEHTLVQGPAALTNLLRAAEGHDMPIFVKPNALDPLLIRDAMDAGAHGVLLPFVSSAEQLKEIEQQCRFAPMGNRGFCPVSRSMNYAAEMAGGPAIKDDYVEFVNEHMLFIPIIETLDGVENLDEILAVPGFEVFHVGMGDLIFAVYEEGEDYDYMVRLADMMCKKIHDAGKIVMGNIELRDPADQLPLLIERFHNHMPYVTDSTLLAYACKESMKLREQSIPLVKALLDKRAKASS